MSHVETLLKADPEKAGALLEISQLHGSQYLQRAAQWIRDYLDVFAVSIGEISGPACDAIEVVGFASRALPEAMKSYPLRGTPCLDVIDSQRSVCLHDAQLSYPDNAGFEAHSIRSYVGLPLRDGFDRTFGLICLFDDVPRRDADDMLQLLGWFAPRIGSEAGSNRTRRNMVNSVDWMEQVSPDDVFASAAAHLCKVMQVTTAFVMECSDAKPGEGILRTFCHCGESHAQLQGRRVHFAGTPFERLMEQDTVIIPDNLDEVLPDGPLLRELGLKSFLGTIIRDHRGLVIGQVGIAHTRSIQPLLMHSPVFGLYTARLAAELNRLKNEDRHEELQQTLSVRHKLESIGLMAGHIAHDFNNLLMAILGNANLAAGLLEPDSPVRRFIENIEAASTAAGDVVSQLLDYAGRKPNRPETIGVSETVAAASRLVELSHYPSARVDYQLAVDLPLVKAEPAQFQQVVVNLVLNAAEALMGRTGVITISTERVHLDAREAERLILGRNLPGGDYVCICVADTGIGMDKTLLARVFDPFFTSKPDGRGLGLSAVRGFVEGCGGGLGLVTEPDVGTRVSVYLEPSEDADAAGLPADESLRVPRAVTPQSPAAPTPHAPAAPTPHAPAAPTPHAPAAQALHVLVVDDELVIAEMAARMLLDLNYRVRVCTSGAAAIAAAGELDFDCALLDVRMPRMDGWTTLRRIRELQQGLPVVMMSGYASEAHPPHLLERLDTVMLRKPFTQKDLVTAVARASRRAKKQTA